MGMPSHLQLVAACCLAILVGLTTPAFAATPCPSGNGVSTRRSKIGNSWKVTATGCPNYSPYGQSSPSTPTCQNKNFYIPIKPTINSNTLWVGLAFANGSSNPAGGVLGPIGYALNGVPVHGDADAKLRDAVLYDGRTFDGCNGHADSNGNYHYHSEPGTGCVYRDVAGRHSPMFAIMADGIPLYGKYGTGGVVPKDLDECGGHASDGLGYYHYHLPATTSSPYTVRCLRGCVLSNFGDPKLARKAQCSPNTTVSYDWSKLTVNWTAGSGDKTCAVGAPALKAPPSASMRLIGTGDRVSARLLASRRTTSPALDPPPPPRRSTVPSTRRSTPKSPEPPESPEFEAPEPPEREPPEYEAPHAETHDGGGGSTDWRLFPSPPPSASGASAPATRPPPATARPPPAASSARRPPPALTRSPPPVTARPPPASARRPPPAAAVRRPPPASRSTATPPPVRRPPPASRTTAGHK